MFSITGGITTVSNVNGVVRHLLDTGTLDITLTLLSGHPFDTRLLRIEVVGDGIHRIRGAVVDKLGARIDDLDGVALLGRLLQLDRIGTSIRIDLLVIHVDPHEVGLEVHLLVLDISLFVDVNHLLLHLIHQRILILTVDHIIQERFAVNRHRIRRP